MKSLVNKTKEYFAKIVNTSDGVYLLGMTILSLSLFFTLLTFFIFGGETAKLFFGSVPGDQFADILNPIETIKRVGIRHVYDDPVSATASYPPFAVLVLAFMSIFVPTSEITIMRESPSYSFLIIAYTTICVVLMAVLIYKLTKPLDKVGKRIPLILFILISPAIIFLFLRGNLLLVCIVLILAFLCFYNSDNKWLKEMALISLVLAVGIKIYPVVFGGLLLKERKYKELLRCFYYTIILYVASFLILGGFYQVKNLINNMAYASSHFGKEALLVSPATLLNFSNSFTGFFSLFGIDKEYLLSISNFVLYPIAIIIAIGSFFLKEKWKTLFCYSFIAIMIPTYSWLYAGLLYIVPLIFFVIKGNFRKIDYLYIVELCLLISSYVFIDKVILGVVEGNADKALNGYVYQVAQHLLLITIIVDEIVTRILAYRNKKDAVEQAPLENNSVNNN